MPGKGRPSVKFDRGMIEFAKETMGSCIFPGRCAKRLVQKYRFGTESAYKLLATAREEVLNGLRESGSTDDPASVLACFYLGILANGKIPVETKIAAANGLSRMLALGRQLNAGPTSQNDVEDFLANLQSRQAARKAANPEEAKP